MQRGGGVDEREHGAQAEGEWTFTYPVIRVLQGGEQVDVVGEHMKTPIWMEGPLLAYNLQGGSLNKNVRGAL